MLSLPPELCVLILSEVEIKDIASLARTSHAMLDRFVPYFWEDVKARWLIALLPDVYGMAERSGQTGTHIPLPGNHLDRFILYAQHVKSISMGARWYRRQLDDYQHQQTWPFLLSYASAFVLFPNLTKLHLEISDESGSIPWDWASLFIVPTLTEVRYNVPDQADQEHSRMLQLILSTCLGLERMSLSVYGGSWTWDQVASSPIPWSLKCLKVCSGIMGTSFLTWAGRMPKLETLDLQPQVWGNYYEASVPNIDLLPESFPSLLFLKYTGGDTNPLAQLCRTPIVTHLTRLVLATYISLPGGIATSQLFALVAAHSVGLQEFECCGRYDLVDSDIASLYPLSLRRLKLSSSSKTRLELLMPTLSGLSPMLKDLDLGHYVSLGTIMHLPLRLLRLEALSVCVDSMAIDDAVDTSHLSGASLDRIRAIWLSHPFTLTVKYSQWERPEPVLLDRCAKILAMTWPCMVLRFCGPEYTIDPVPHAAIIEKKVSDYAELVLQSGRLI
ncbi:hypothetical protein BDV93DRAFT_607482 [Ceratobasidium sp. AG-I]|nr:hypothetical protein BDV93DRAFT_607482 [Ceratobasidium sp. AG-I]